MVEVKEGLDEFGKTVITVSDMDKTQASYTIQKTRDGYVFYEVVASVGKIPKVLEGRYSRPVDAEKAVVHYLNTMKQTKRTQIKKRYEEE